MSESERKPIGELLNYDQFQLPNGLQVTQIVMFDRVASVWEVLQKIPQNPLIERSIEVTPNQGDQPKVTRSLVEVFSSFDEATENPKHFIIHDLRAVPSASGRTEYSLETDVYHPYHREMGDIAQYFTHTNDDTIAAFFPTGRHSNQVSKFADTSSAVEAAHAALQDALLTMTEEDARELNKHRTHDANPQFALDIESRKNELYALLRGWVESMYPPDSHKKEADKAFAILDALGVPLDVLLSLGEMQDIMGSRRSAERTRDRRMKALALATLEHLSRFQQLAQPFLMCQFTDTDITVATARRKSFEGIIEYKREFIESHLHEDGLSFGYGTPIPVGRHSYTFEKVGTTTHVKVETNGEIPIELYSFTFQMPSRDAIEEVAQIDGNFPEFVGDSAQVTWHSPQGDMSTTEIALS